MKQKIDEEISNATGPAIAGINSDDTPGPPRPKKLLKDILKRKRPK